MMQRRRFGPLRSLCSHAATNCLRVTGDTGSSRNAAARIEDYYRLGVQIGKGGFGDVKVGEELATGRQFAVKILSKLKFAGEIILVLRRGPDHLQPC